MHDADREWMGDAACRDADTDLFFPAAAESSPEAEAFCHRCPVRDQCLRYALADPELVASGPAPVTASDAACAAPCPERRR